MENKNTNFDTITNAITNELEGHSVTDFTTNKEGFKFYCNTGRIGCKYYAIDVIQHFDSPVEIRIAKTTEDIETIKEVLNNLLPTSIII